jgi:hypothetical protein
MQLATKLGSRRATLHLACALAVTCSVPGCITYTTVIAKDSTYRELAISSALAAIEIGGGVLGGYVLYKEEEGSADRKSLGAQMLSVTGGFLLVDGIIALGMYLSDR